ncbi:MAG: hypothetical protein WCW13_02245 [archaeon]|jgi:hypothetical protein
MRAVKRTSSVSRRRGVIDVLEFGSGNGKWMAEKAKQNRRKLHVAVEHAWSAREREQTANDYYKQQAGSPPKGLVVTSSTTMENFIKGMLRNNIVANNIFVRMPDWVHVRTRTMNFGLLMKNAKKLLLRKGRITLTTENKEILTYIKGLAWKAGLSVKSVPVLPETFHEKKYSDHPLAGHMLYGIEISLSKKR